MVARPRPRILGPFKWLIVLWMLCAASLASAAQVQLREAMHEGPPPAAVPVASPGASWTWFTLDDAAPLQAMPGGWKLLVDQVRFEAIRVVVTGRDGRVQDVALGADALQDNWAAGGLLTFDIAVAGPQVRSLSLGFNRLDSPSLIRKVTAVTPRQAAESEAHWLMLMGIFAGLLVSGFVYNLFVHAGRHQPFQRWYLGWVLTSLAYGLIWSNLAAHVFPGLAGPLAVRIDNVLVGLTVALGSVFLLSVLEAGKVPRRLRQAIVALALASVGSGLLAADERLIAAGTTDLALNLCLLASVGTSLVAIVIAIARGSRVIWLYLLGWSPVIAVYAARAARNFGLVGQSDAVDLATFAAIGFESLVFSLIIADRFRAMRRERDEAEASARTLQVEQEALRRAARTDFLTGLGNRAAFHESLRELYAHKTRLALFLIDVDHLKELNDRQGHDAGDALLRRMGEALSGLTGPATTCARIGGDEFAIVCEDASAEKERIASALDRLQGTAWTRDSWSGVLSLSVGVAGSEGATSPADLFQQADIALYEAKNLGRGRRQAFDSRLRQQIQSKLDLIKDAHWALRRSEFTLHFQPIVDLRTGKPAGVEALVRWQHPRMGLLTPESFECVLADEEIGQAVQQRVLKLALDQLRRHPDLGGTLAVNFTAMDLNGPPAAFRLLRKLAAAGVAPSALCVEVTEGTLLGKPGDPATALQLLHEAGVRIALDDFGTGYASLVHLKEIPVDTLKIDRSFIAGLLDGDESEEIVRAVLALGHGLKKSVIAEGVETPEQLARLRELGCDFAQGYLFGRPSPVFDWQATFQAAA